MTRSAGPDRVSLITDAMAATGMADGAYRLGPLAVDVVDGVARVAGTDTIAGSTATMDRVFRFAVAHSGLPRDEALLLAVRQASVNPARALGLPDAGLWRRCRRRPGGAGRRPRRHRRAAPRIVGGRPRLSGVFSANPGWPGQWTPMHTTPLLTERDTDLRRAIQAVDPEEETTVLPAVVEPARDPRHGFVLATAGGVVGLGALALLVALVLATSNDSTRPAVVSPPLAPVTTTTTAQAVTTAPSAESTPSPSASAAPPPPSPVDTPPPTAVVSAEKMAPSVPAQDQDPVRTRLRELFPRLFP